MIVTLLTDFGITDTYVGVMKGVILGRAPNVHLVDLSHEVPPQAVDEATFLLDTAWRYFPESTIHLVVVDPGVGTTRARLAISSQGHYFIGPDNGVLSAALPSAIRGLRQPDESYEPRTTSGQKISAVRIENESLFLQPVSATFEGRDIFAPAAAHLAGGGSFSDLGPATSEMLAFPDFRAPLVDGRIHGVILRADRFGNLITDILAADLPADPVFTVAGRQLRLTATYGSADGPMAIAGSNGHIEIAMANGSAALLLGAGQGDRVLVTE